METVQFSETSVNFYMTSRCYVWEDKWTSTAFLPAWDDIVTISRFQTPSGVDCLTIFPMKSVVCSTVTNLDAYYSRYDDADGHWPRLIWRLAASVCTGFTADEDWYRKLCQVSPSSQLLVVPSRTVRISWVWVRNIRDTISKGQTPSWEANGRSAIQGTCRLLRRFIAVFTGAFHWSLS
jgi:hypothetical protein